MNLVDRRVLVARTGRWQWYWGLFGLVTVSAFAAAIFSVLFTLAEIWPGFSAVIGFEVSDTVFLSPGRWDTYASFVVASLPIILATAATIKWVHGWSVGHVFGSDGRFSWGHFGRAAAAIFAVYAISTLIDFLSSPADYKVQAQHWNIVLWIVLAGVVILPQAFSEDFLFNGYLMRLWGAVVPVRFVVPIVLSALFSLAHVSNEDVGQDPWPAHASLFSAQLLALLIYVRTGSLGATVGMHWMNNTFSAGLVGSLPGYENDLALVIYRDPVLSAGGTNLYDPWFWFGLVAGLWLVWLLLSWRRSPFYIPDRTDVPPPTQVADTGRTTAGGGATGFARET